MKRIGLWALGLFVVILSLCVCRRNTSPPSGEVVTLGNFDLASAPAELKGMLGGRGVEEVRGRWASLPSSSARKLNLAVSDGDKLVIAIGRAPTEVSSAGGLVSSGPPNDQLWICRIESKKFQPGPPFDFVPFSSGP